MKHLKRLWAFLVRPGVYWRIFSLVLAMIFWLLAAGDGSIGEAERTIFLEIEVHNQPTELVLVDHPGSVSVTIRGLSPLLNRGESAIFASIDLAGAQAGTETYSVEVEAPVGIDIVSVTPRFVSVFTEGVAESAFPVTLALLGIERAQIVSGLRPSPPVVTVRGATSILEQVDHVVAYLSLDDGLSLDGTFPVWALDAQGRSLRMLEIEPAEIGVDLEAEQLSMDEEE